MTFVNQFGVTDSFETVVCHRICGARKGAYATMGCSRFVNIAVHGPLRSRALLAANSLPRHRGTRAGSALECASSHRRMRRARQFPRRCARPRRGIPGAPACVGGVSPDPPSGAQPTGETAGVLNVIVSAVASIQVADALRILTGADLRARITTLDLWNGGIRQIDAPARDPDCPACARGEFPYLPEARRPPEGLCGPHAVPILRPT